MPFGYVTVVIGFIADIYLFGTKFSLLGAVGIVLTSTGLLSGYLITKPKKDNGNIVKDEQ